MCCKNTTKKVKKKLALLWDFTIFIDILLIIKKGNKMKQNVSKHDFMDAFKIRKDNFSYEGLDALYDYLIDLSSELGGVYSAEHGTGKRKRNDFKKCYGEEAVQMIKKLKQSLDPKNYLNQGNIVN